MKIKGEEVENFADKIIADNTFKINLILLTLKSLKIY